jgi:hypothetical protein
MITVQREGTGSGTVTSSPTGIDCGATCTASFPASSQVTLTAAADSSSIFTSWNGPCTGTDACMVTVPVGNTSVTAHFEVAATISVTLLGSGPGIVSSSPAGLTCSSGTCSGRFRQGMNVTLTATPSGGSSFIQWGGQVSCPATQASCQLSPGPGTTSVTATFSDWQLANPFPPALGAVGQVGGHYVALGADGKFVHSDDGRAWVTGTLPVTANLNALAVGGNGGVAVGGGTVLSSPDGTTWTPRTSGTTEHLLAVRFAGGQFLATGYAGTVLTSADGITWSSRTSGTGQYLGGVAQGAGVYVAVGSRGAIIGSSDGGVTWAPRTSGISAVLHDVAFGASLFAAVGAVSGPARPRCSPRPTAPPGRRGPSPASTRPWWRSAGWGRASWRSTRRDRSCPRPMGSRSPMLLEPGGYGPIGQHDGTAIHGVAYGAGLYVAVGSNGTVITSPDGLVWTSRRATDTASPGLGAVVYAAGQFVAVGSAREILTSPDGITWMSRTDPLTMGGLAGIAYGAGRYVAVGYASSGAAVSSDGITWTPVDPGAATLYAITFAGGRFVAVGDQGTILTSTDGLSYVPRSSGTQQGLDGIAFGASTYVAVGPNGTCLTSPDGATWTPRTLPSAVGAKTVAFGGTSFVAVGNGIYTSPDGVNWTFQLPVGPELEGIGYGPSGFVAGGIFQTLTVHP